MTRKLFVVFMVTAAICILYGIHVTAYAQEAVTPATSKWTISNATSETSSTTTQIQSNRPSSDITAEAGQIFLMIQGLFTSSDMSPSGKLEDIYLKDTKNNTWQLKGIEFYYQKSRCHFLPETFSGKMFGMIAPGSSDNSHTLEIRQQLEGTPHFTYHLSKPASELDLLFVIPANKAKDKFTLHFSGASVVLPKPGSGKGKP